MKAMILAAGKGTRVRPITNNVPKPMIPLLQKPVLESIISHLKTHGVDEIVINTSYLSTQIENYFGNGDRFGVHIAYSFEGEMIEDSLVSKALGSAGGMKKIQEYANFFDDTFLVLCADALIDLDITKAVEIHKQKKALASIALKQVEKKEVNKYGIVKLSAQNRVLTFQEKPQIEDAVSTLANTGIYIFEPEIFDQIPSNQEYDIGGELLPDIVEKGLEVYGINLPYEWIDIGNVNDFYHVTCKILNKEIRDYHIHAKEIREGVFVGLNVKINLDRVNLTPPVFIGSSSHIEDGATIIGPSMIGSNCCIKKDAVVEESIIDDYKKINSLANINKKIVFSDSIICLDGVVTNTKQSDLSWLVDDIRRNSFDTSMEQTIQSLIDIRSSK